MKMRVRKRHLIGRRRAKRDDVALPPSCVLLDPFERGQSLMIIGIMLPVLMALLMAALEYQERTAQHALLQDAMQQATRSGAQSFEYARFAENTSGFREETGGATKQGCRMNVAGADANVTTPPEGSARAIACDVLIANLRGVRGLAETPERTANLVTWTIHPHGGTCTFPNGRPSVQHPNEPLVCATVRPPMTGLGLFGPGIWIPQVDAADTLDRAQH
jgi:hypothetical protein